MAVENERTLRRKVRQQLDSLQRAGVSHLPRCNVTIVESSTEDSVAEGSRQHLADDIVSEATPIERTLPVEQTARSAAAVSETAITPDPSAPTSSQSLFGNVDSPPTTGEESPRVPVKPLSRLEREERLKKLACRVAECKRCQELAETRTQTVFGVGNPEARIMFVGEAPGADEDRQGEPFVGRAGKLLNDIITACRLTREEIYICNILRCRPPQNRTPSPEEAANCREYLDGQISTIDPEYIVCWGSVAAQNLLETKVSTGKLRGSFHSYGRAKVLCTYHPAYLLRNPPAKKDVWEDMKFLMSDMGVDLSKK